MTETAPSKRFTILVLANRENYVSNPLGDTYLDTDDMVFVGPTATAEQALAAAPNADILFADSVASVPRALIEGMPNLKLINTEGVGFNGVDCEAAAERGIPVCNNAGGNAHAVAEQAILLMLGLLRHVLAWDAAVRDGRQFEAKAEGFANGITDLADCTVGIIGLGNSGQALAKRLQAFGTRVLYTGRRRKSPALEQELHVEWCELPELLGACDIVSLHTAVTEDTVNMADAAFFAQMKDGAYLINTARGDLVVNEDLADALRSGKLAGAGLDTIAPEPVTSDNLLLNLEPAVAARILFSPHVAGITTGSRNRMQAHMWDNLARVARGEKPTCIVNGL